MSDELDSSDRRKYLKILERTRSNLRGAEEYLHATRRAYFIDADAIRVRFESARRIANSNGSKYGKVDERVDYKVDGRVNEHKEPNQHRRSLARTRHNLVSAEGYLRQTSKIDSDFQARARTHRAYLTFNAQAAQRGYERNERDALADLETGRLLGERERIITPTGVACEHNCLSLATASAEMKAVAAQNVRVKDPVYHVVLSWPTNESPTDDKAFECGVHALAAVGMADHQYVFAVHRDTDNVHLHIAVNRVHPDTFNVVYPERDYFKLDRAMRELEVRYGWQHDNGPYAVFERDGVQVIDWSSHDPNTKGKRPTRASDMERHDNKESLFSYARGGPRKALLSALKNEQLTWRQLHNLLSKYGLALREKGQGFAIFDLASEETTPIKASDMHEALSKGRLTKRLGAFERPVAAETKTFTTSYDKYNEPKRDLQQREERRQERAQARRELRERYNRYKKLFFYRRLSPDDVRLRYASLTDDTRRRRIEVRNTITNLAARKALYSVIAFETLRARDRLRREILRERQALKLDPTNHRQTYKEWVECQAADGDVAAINQLRAWAYSEKRQSKNVSQSFGNGICHTRSNDVVGNDLREGIYYRVRRDGAIAYKTEENRDGFVDHGLHIDIPANTDIDRNVIEAALKLACKKYDNHFALTGSEEFQRRVIDIMVECKMDVRLEDAGQEALRLARFIEVSKERGPSRPDRGWTR
ncbi:MAG: relaxase/mobilization nuclease domain-containing protein [Ottowia sp.]|nr:relaxase/mobilization nuclease domain-containing protein [Ottowia sp.]